MGRYVLGFIHSVWFQHIVDVHNGRGMVPCPNAQLHVCIIAVYCCVAGWRTLPLSLLAAAIGCRPFTIFLAAAMFTFFVLDDCRGKKYGGIAERYWETLNT
jgi:hypothetical protein